MCWSVRGTAKFRKLHASKEEIYVKRTENMMLAVRVEYSPGLEWANDYIDPE
jgi:hypothetical protein